MPSPFSKPQAKMECSYFLSETNVQRWIKLTNVSKSSSVLDSRLFPR